MTTPQLRLAIVVLLAIALAFGIYLGWHATHHATSCVINGRVDPSC